VAGGFGSLSLAGYRDEQSGASTIAGFRVALGRCLWLVIGRRASAAGTAAGFRADFGGTFSEFFTFQTLTPYSNTCLN
jgi:hypothetical protein